MKSKEVTDYIVSWLKEYVEKSGLEGYVVGISGGIDSALTSTLCASTGKKVILVTMPIRQRSDEYLRAIHHIQDLKERFENVSSYDIDLSDTFEALEKSMPFCMENEHLAMANARARLRMTTLYSIAQTNGCLVAGTGNKIEDFGIGFFTKYGDGGVDISPIADLTKSNVRALAKELNVIEEIIVAKPTDGLWADGRSDEDQIGATYPELEWAMEFKGDESSLSARETEVLKIYRRLHRINRHKVEPIPVCIIPEDLK